MNQRNQTIHHHHHQSRYKWRLTQSDGREAKEVRGWSRQSEGWEDEEVVRKPNHRFWSPIFRYERPGMPRGIFDSKRLHRRMNQSISLAFSGTDPSQPSSFRRERNTPSSDWKRFIVLYDISDSAPVSNCVPLPLKPEKPARHSQLPMPGWGGSGSESVSRLHEP